MLLFLLYRYKPILSNVSKENLFKAVKFYFLGLHPCSVAREQRNLRMLRFVLGKFWKESKMSIVFVGKGDSSPGGGGVLPYMGYIGMCGPKGYSFQPFRS